MLLSDDLTDSASTVLPDSSPDPDHYQRGYIDGEYMLQRVDPEWDGVAFAYLPGTFPDAKVAADVRLAGEPSGEPWVELGCRVDPKNAGNQYRLELAVTAGRVRFEREDDHKFTALIDWRPAPFMSDIGDTNHIELTCAGSTFSATVNGQALFQVRDTTYRDGRLELIMGGRNSVGDGRFSNLVVTQR